MPHLLNRLEITDAQVLKALEIITLRTGDRMAEHGKFAHASKHESVGIIMEEVQEMLEAMRLKDTKPFVDEVVDVIVAGVWTLASVIAGSDVDAPPVEEESLKKVFVPPTATDKNE